MLHGSIATAAFSLLWYVVLYKILVPRSIYVWAVPSAAIAIQLGVVSYASFRDDSCVHALTAPTIHTVMLIRFGCILTYMWKQSANFSHAPSVVSGAAGVYVIASTIRIMTNCGLVVALLEFGLIIGTVVGILKA